MAASPLRTTMPATGNNTSPVPRSHKCTLVPSAYFAEDDARCILSDLYPLDDSETVSFVSVPSQDAVLVYAGDSVPPVFDLLSELPSCPDHNKILMCHAGGCLDLVIARGDQLLLVNSYPAPDFVTAEYFLFLAMKTLQLNPEVSCVRVRSELSAEEEMSLYRYFKAVERI